MVKPGVLHRQRRPRRADRRAGAGRRAAPRAGSPAPASTCSPRSRAPRQPAVRAATTWSSPRTWARPPREAQDKAGTAVARSRCSWRCTATSCRTRSTCRPAASVAEEVRPLLPLAEKLGTVLTAVAGGVAGQRRPSRCAASSSDEDVAVLQLAAHARACSPASSRSRSPSSTRRGWPRSAASRSTLATSRRAPTTAAW